MVLLVTELNRLKDLNEFSLITKREGWLMKKGFVSEESSKRLF